MSTLYDGHTTIDASVEPDGRIRMTVSEAGDVIAAPTFAAVDFTRATQAVAIPKRTVVDARTTALESIAKALGWTPDQRPHWPEQVLRRLEADGLTITRTEPTGDGND